VNSFQQQLLDLGRLQEVDLEIDHLVEEEASIPPLIKRTKAKIKAAEEALEDRKARLKDLQSERRQKEREMEMYDERVRVDNGKLMDVKTNQEYHAIQKEIEFNRNESDVRAEDILLLFEKIEAAEMEMKKEQAQFEESKMRIEKETVVHRERLGQIPGEIAELTGRKNDLEKEIDTVFLRRYEGLRKRKAGIAIVKADGGVCQGCNMSVAPQTVNKLQRNEELIFCSNCQRILYWEGEARVHKLEPGNAGAAFEGRVRQPLPGIHRRRGGLHVQKRQEDA